MYVFAKARRLGARVVFVCRVLGMNRCRASLLHKQHKQQHNSIEQQNLPAAPHDARTQGFVLLCWLYRASRCTHLAAVVSFLRKATSTGRDDRHTLAQCTDIHQYEPHEAQRTPHNTSCAQ